MPRSLRLLQPQTPGPHPSRVRAILQQVSPTSRTGQPHSGCRPLQRSAHARPAGIRSDPLPAIPRRIAPPLLSRRCVTFNRQGARIAVALSMFASPRRSCYHAHSRRCPAKPIPLCRATTSSHQPSITPEAQSEGCLHFGPPPTGPAWSGSTCAGHHRASFSAPKGKPVRGLLVGSRMAEPGERTQGISDAPG